MADKIQNSYKSSKNFYDALITHKSWWSRLYAKIIWQGADNNVIAAKLLAKIPADFSGKMLDLPVGTGIFTHKKYRNLKKAEIICLDYSEDMLSIARERLSGEHIQLRQGDVADLPFADQTFDIIFSMNGFHVFPDKDKAWAEMSRVLKKDGLFLVSCYIEGKGRLADFFAKKILAKKGWLSVPFDSEEAIKQRLTQDFELDFFDCQGSLIYFGARKVR